MRRERGAAAGTHRGAERRRETPTDRHRLDRAGAFEAEEFDAAVAPAIAEATTPIDDYLMGMPHLAEYLEAGLEALGVDVKG